MRGRYRTIYSDVKHIIEGLSLDEFEHAILQVISTNL
jgi:hypothetical protein